MQSRMDRYYDVIDEDNVTNEYVPTNSMSSRTKKNEELYQEVSSLEINDFDVNSNVSVLGKNKKSIDISEIKDIIDRKYHVEPKSRSIGVDDTQEIPEINLSETREYDINSIIEKARSSKEVNYEEDRLKKLKNTQYDILKNLNLDLKEEKVEKKPKEEIIMDDTLSSTDSLIEDLNNTITDTELLEVTSDSIDDTPRKAMVSETKNNELLDLINTITTKELIQDTQEIDPLDILSDLRGDNDNTKVMGAMFSDMLEEELKEQKDKKIDVKKEEKIKQSEVKDEKVEEETVETKIVQKLNDIDEEKSPTIRISKAELESEYDDFKDLKDDMKISRLIVKVLLILIVLVFIVGCFILLDKVFGWGLIKF